jgi:hypothetical protein
LRAAIVEGLNAKLEIIDEIKVIIDKYKLNPTFNNIFDLHHLKKDHRKEISKDLSSNIVV